MLVGVASTNNSASISSIKSIDVLLLSPIESSETDLLFFFTLSISLMFIPFSSIATPFESATATIFESIP